jgi:wyosine [tRNA(Phe)-imidazoG37] synthetase (radical SAM superfamily)
MKKQVTKNNYKYIYGPVPSWRLGRSLGVDPLSAKDKICTFDCSYCQLGKTKVYSSARKIFVPTDDIIEEIKALPKIEIDYITISGRGEPTLALNLGELISAIKKIRKEKVAVITNSSLLSRQDVVAELCQADLIVAKLDAPNSGVFNIINNPLQTITFSEILSALQRFARVYKGKLALQCMFLEENKRYVNIISRLANNMRPDEIELNTPLRPCAVKPLARAELNKIKEYFLQSCNKAINIVSVYDAKKVKTTPISDKDTLKRRGKYKNI